MTRKDYVRLAAALDKALYKALYYGAPDDDEARAAAHGVHYAIEAIAAELAADNPRFDRARFIAAAGAA